MQIIGDILDPNMEIIWPDFMSDAVTDPVRLTRELKVDPKRMVRAQRELFGRAVDRWAINGEMEEALRKALKK